MLKPNHLLTIIVSAPVIASSSPAQGASETDWWRTTGAAVVQHPYGVRETACSLFLVTA
jgi:hypothetical protein